MDWDFYSSLIEEDVFSSFLNANEPIYQVDSVADTPNSEPKTDQNQSRLAKNRESARNTRKKKKQQLQLLEKRVAELTEEVETLRQEAEGHSQFRKGEICQKYKSDKQKLYEKLETLLQENGSEQEFKDIIETLRVKLGANGVERQGYIEYLIHQISDVSLPQQVKTLLNTEQVKKTYFWDELLDLNHTKSEQQGHMEQYLNMVIQRSEEFKSTMKKLKRIKKCLLRRTGHFQNLIDYISSQLTARQIASLLVRINKEHQGLNPWNE